MSARCLLAWHKGSIACNACQVLIHYEKGVPPTSEELAKKLESKKDSCLVVCCK